MARFIGRLQGARGEVSRLGTPNSGMRASAQGWNLGGEVIMSAHGDTDKVTIYVTSGSGASRPKRLVYEGTVEDFNNETADEYLKKAAAKNN